MPTQTSHRSWFLAATSLLAGSLLFGPGLARGATPHPDADRVERVRQAEVVVVQGSADHIEQVLRRAQMRFVLVNAEELPQLPLHSQQVLMVNCLGMMSALARDRVRRFVAAGGFLYTTDHAVHHLVEKIFPRTIAWNNVRTNMEVFPMKARGSRGLLRKLGESATREWQLAGGGFLFKILDPQRVQVLMESEQVAKRYGSGVLGVRFKHEDGYVIHVSGHFYSQPGQQPLVAGRSAGGGRAFEQLSENVVTEKRGDKGRIDALYGSVPKRAVKLQVAPTAAAPSVAAGTSTRQVLDGKARVRVLAKKKGYLKVRDEQGNEGWVDDKAF